MSSGGELVAETLDRHGVRSLFTLCGGHISPILVAAEARGIRIVDVRDEASAAFAADATARLTGLPGVAVVTAGPGVTNTLTAVKNAQLAHSPLVLLGGATGTVLKGRGALQDIDQRALLEPHVKWWGTVRRVRDLPEAVGRAFSEARSGTPGPVFVECPVDLLYEEEVVRGLYPIAKGELPGLGGRLLSGYLRWHLRRLFSGAGTAPIPAPVAPPPREARGVEVDRIAGELARAARPVMLLGSQAVLRVDEVGAVAAAVDRLGVPVYLSGMARGLLGPGHPRLFRHRRREALGRADLVLRVGVPCDFRLDYGRPIGPGARHLAVGLSGEELRMNRRPHVGVLADPGPFLRRLVGAGDWDAASWNGWIAELRHRDDEREAQIAERAAQPTEYLNPLRLCRDIDAALAEDSVLVADGGDFVATASYVLRPRGPLRWLDPGVFGTLGVGGGFALGAKTAQPGAEVWILYGDGSAAYSLAEIDSFVRHGLPVIAVVGNDASWMQIAREQVEILGKATGTELRRTDYHVVAEGYGGRGFLLERPEDTAEVLAAAKAAVASGTPALINALIGRTDFRKGSISM